MLTVQPPDSATEVNPDDYHFCHTINLPGLGEMTGDLDLRNDPEAYLGNISVTNKRVLEISAASGFLSFHMEKKGASVVSYIVSPDDGWDTAPCTDPHRPAHYSALTDRFRKIKNAYRLSHNVMQSRAELVEGRVHEISNRVGRVDISALNSVLLHVRDPFLALEQAARLTRETIVITEILDDDRPLLIDRLFGWLGNGAVRRIRHSLVGPSILFRPAADVGHFGETLWYRYLTPELLGAVLRVQGFSNIRITYHWQHLVRQNRRQRMYTLVANRTVPMPTT